MCQGNATEENIGTTRIEAERLKTEPIRGRYPKIADGGPVNEGLTDPLQPRVTILRGVKEVGCAVIKVRGLSADVKDSNM